MTSLHSAGVAPGAPVPRMDVSMAASVAAPSSDSWAVPCGQQLSRAEARPLGNAQGRHGNKSLPTDRFQCQRSASLKPCNQVSSQSTEETSVWGGCIVGIMLSISKIRQYIAQRCCQTQTSSSLPAGMHR